MNNPGNEEIETVHRMVCSECVSEPYLVDLIQSNNECDSCYYCDRDDVLTISIGALSELVEGAIATHFNRTSSEPEGYEYYLQREGKWDRAGDPVGEVIQSLCVTDEAVADDICEVIDDRTSDWDSVQMGEEQPYGGEAQYEEISKIDHSELWREFREFERLIIEEARFFSPETRRILFNLFDGLDGQKTADGRSVLVSAGPGEAIHKFFRARTFQDDIPLLDALARPDRELGPPPRRAGRSGRLNAHGVSIFYGSNSAETALAEVRPPVGSRVVVAEFDVLRPILLLDIEALREVFVEGSNFDPGYAGRLQHAAFLRTLSARFTRPVMPDHEAFDYLATQAIADYLAHETSPALDGILYSSAQSDEGERANVALFFKSSRVEHIPLPEGAKVDAITGWSGEDDFEIDYNVFVKIPEEKAAETAGITRSAMDFLHIENSPQPSWDPDPRAPLLRVIPQSLKVHHVRAVRVSTDPYSVSRSDYSENNDF